MTFPRLAGAGLVLFLVSFSEAASVRFDPKPPQASPSASYKGAIVVDAPTGSVLFEDGADTVGPPASMTKLMTFAVLHDRIAAGALTLDTPVKIMPADARMGGTQVYLDPRETFPVEELIHAMVIQSANDAAHALARAAAGSVPAFIDLMNAKARELGMSNTTFRTPHGLPPPSRRIAEGDLTSPRDFAVLSRYLIEHTDILKYTSIRLRPFGQGIRAEPMQMTSHNKLVGRVDGVDGLKTGFTAGAGFCLAATALREGRRVIVVTMGSSEARTRDLSVIELLDRGFAEAASAAQAAVAGASEAGARPVVSPLRPATTGGAMEPASTPSAPPKVTFPIPKR